MISRIEDIKRQVIFPAVLDREDLPVALLWLNFGTWVLQVFGIVSAIYMIIKDLTMAMLFAFPALLFCK
jgi:hypothetical protein